MPSDADELYGLAFDEFIPARNALARELRGAGRREEAGEVAALRKPSVAAWAVNQLVRTQRRGFDDLLVAGDALRAAHDDVLAGRGDAGALRDAVAREREAVEALSRVARGLLTSQGHELSPTILERVSDTLHAAALDDDARASVREGRLERELRHVGLGMTAGAVPTRGRARQPKPAAKPEPPRDRAAEREARRRLERATRALSTARERRDKAAAALDEAEEALAEAEREVEDAEKAVREL
jgi:hypothetical protein